MVSALIYYLIILLLLYQFRSFLKSPERTRVNNRRSYSVFSVTVFFYFFNCLLRINAIRVGYFNTTAGHLDVEALLRTRAYQLSSVGSLKLFNIVLYIPI